MRCDLEQVELIVPINNSSHRDPKTLYALTDFEIFSDLGRDEVSERFANTSRFRLGVGWRFDLQWRAEFLYGQQKSRNTLQQDFETSDSIYRIRIKFQPLRRNPALELEEQPHH